MPVLWPLAQPNAELSFAIPALNFLAFGRMVRLGSRMARPRQQ